MSRKRSLSPEERTLWGKVAKTVRPLPTGLGEREEGLKKENQKDETPGLGGKQVGRFSLFAAEGSKPKTRQALGVSGDPKTFRRMGRDRAPIEASLDLHGMNQIQAHQALGSFLARCFEGGLRAVLVITGKGPPTQTGLAHFSPSRGILRRRFVQWAEEDFAHFISAFRQAQPRHGGSGAFYVTLKKRKDKAVNPRGFLQK
jgi:DNA-nicking Smr family endonuclease